MIYQRLLIILFAVTLFTSPAFSEDVVLKNDQLVTKSFLGFGAEWDIHGYVAHGVTDQDFQLITARIQKMKLPIVRIMMLGKYCYTGNGQYDWNSPQMKYIYKQLDFCQKQRIKVILCSWGAGTVDGSWLKIPGISGVDDPNYATVVGTFMDHLINVKGYTCIKYFSAGNEPDLELLNDWAKWKNSVIAISENFKKRGLSQKFVFLGPETSQSKGDTWLSNSAGQMPSHLGAYSMHYYASQTLVKSGGLEQFLVASRSLVFKDSSVKPFLVAEAGMQDGSIGPHTNTYINEFDYGIFIADYAVQAARAGVSSILAWMLDDNSHQNFNWGMWSNKAKGMTIRPWYTTWSLLSNYFPASSTLYRVNQPVGMRILAARAPSKSDPHVIDYSICLVNRDSVSRSIDLNITNAQSKTRAFKHFIYSQDTVNATELFLKKSDELHKLRTPIRVICPPNSVTVLTTM